MSPPISVPVHVVSGCSCGGRLHLELDRHGAGILELQRSLDLFALAERLLQSDEHQVAAARGKSDGLTGLDLDPTFNWPHLGCAALVRCHVNLDPVCPRGGSTQKMIGRRAGVGDSEAASSLCTPL